MKKVNKTIIVILILVFSLTFLAGCQNTGNEENVNNNNTTQNTIEVNNNNLEGLKEYTSKRYDNYIEYAGDLGIRFAYPSTWVNVGVEGQPVYMNPDGSGALVNLSISDYPEGITFKDFMELSKEGIKEQLKIKGDINIERININGVEGYKLEYIATQEDNVSIHTMQVAFIDNGTIYILTVGAEETHFESSKEELEKIISTFKK